MSRTYFHLIFCALLLGSSNVDSLPCEDSRCGTASCDSSGRCVCKLPDPSTFLDGDRVFLGGRYCDEEMMMCDGTNSFWCEHGGRCDEIVQGEVYRCRCPLGFAGERCELSGARCGDIFCFHGAECLSEGESCDCPVAWKGSVDCSIATDSFTGSDSSGNSSSHGGIEQGSDDETNEWVVVLFIVFGSAGVLLGASLYVKKLRRRTGAPKFQQLPKLQAEQEMNEEEENTLIDPERVCTHTDDSRL